MDISFLIRGICLWIPLFLGSLTLIPAQTVSTEQDCFGAIPVCQTVYIQTKAYRGVGRQNEINGAYSCMRIGERNSVWYTFTVQNAGQLCFTIIPMDSTDDYDWAVFDLSNASCAAISTNPALEVRCNWTYNNGCGGRTGANSGLTCPDQSEPCMLVQAGETYVLNVSNFNGSNSGYTLDFSQSTAQLYDNIPPELESLSAYCPGVKVKFTENVSCASVDPSDFAITGPGGNYQVAAINSVQCDGGGNFDQEFGLVFNPPLTQQGVYQVELVGSVNDLCGNASLPGTKSRTLIPPPVSSFKALDPQCIGGNAFRFSYNGPSQVNIFQWEFGDSTGSVEERPVHTYHTSGSKIVTLRVTDAQGCSDTSQQSLEVLPGPIARFGAPSTICLGDTLDLENLTSGIHTNRFVWFFSDGGPNSSEVHPQHIYLFPGYWNITLRAIANNGCHDTAVHRLTVYPSPDADFEIEEDVCLGDTAHFLNLSTIRNDIAADHIDYWEWYFGDSTASGSLLSPAHLYADRGIYPVELRVYSDKGCLGRRVRDMQIHHPDPPLVADDTLCFSQPGILNADPQGMGYSAWYEGYGEDTAFYKGDVYFTPPVTEDIIFFVETISPEGCISDRIPIRAVLAEPQVKLIEATDSLVDLAASQVGFTLAGDIRASSYIWHFGDGDTSLLANPVHSFSYVGKFGVNLQVTDVHGCNYNLLKWVEVRRGSNVTAPSAFSPNQDGVNDLWTVFVEDVFDFEVRVFDRFGKVVFIAEEPGFQWDGRQLDGAHLPEGVYVFSLQAKDAQGDRWAEQGTITLIR